MKKPVIVLLLALFSATMYAQIFTEKKVFDKFDDVIESKTIKTLIDHDIEKGIITFEEKGDKAQAYRIINWCDYASMGDKENIVNLVNDIYGYEDTWCVIKDDDAEAYSSIVDELKDNKLSKDETIEKLGKYWLFITHRVITTQYSHSYQTEYWWIQDESTGTRTIYCKY